MCSDLFLFCLLGEIADFFIFIYLFYFFYFFFFCVKSAMLVRLLGARRLVTRHTHHGGTPNRGLRSAGTRTVIPGWRPVAVGSATFGLGLVLGLGISSTLTGIGDPKTALRHFWEFQKEKQCLSIGFDAARVDPTADVEIGGWGVCPNGMDRAFRDFEFARRCICRSARFVLLHGQSGIGKTRALAFWLHGEPYVMWISMREKQKRGEALDLSDKELDTITKLTASLEGVRPKRRLVVVVDDMDLLHDHLDTPKSSASNHWTQKTVPQLLALTEAGRLDVILCGSTPMCTTRSVQSIWIGREGTHERIMEEGVAPPKLEKTREEVVQHTAKTFSDSNTIAVLADKRVGYTNIYDLRCISDFALQHPDLSAEQCIRHLEKQRTLHLVACIEFHLPHHLKPAVMAILKQIHAGDRRALRVAEENNSEALHWLIRHHIVAVRESSWFTVKKEAVWWSQAYGEAWSKFLADNAPDVASSSSNKVLGKEEEEGYRPLVPNFNSSGNVCPNKALDK